MTSYAAPPKSSITNIYSILSDEDCVKLLQMISEHRQPKINNLGTRKRYYERLSKIRKAHLIIKKKDRSKGDDISNYELTDLGSSLYESLLTLRRAANLRWRLNAIDVLDDRVPIEERIKLIQAIIPDETIRKILLKH
jgi:hypothetical protein